jgi:hypothetical protein
MLDNNNTPAPDPPPDADTVYRNYLERCRRRGVEPVPRDQAHKLIAEWSDTIAASRAVPPIKH